jgi:hypothetical protein
MARFKVVGRHAVFDYEPGEEFEHDVTSQTLGLVAQGHLAHVKQAPAPAPAPATPAPAVEAAPAKVETTTPPATDPKEA